MQTRNAEQKHGWIYSVGLLLEKYFSEEAQVHEENVSTSSEAGLIPVLHWDWMFCHIRKLLTSFWQTDGS